MSLFLRFLRTTFLIFCGIIALAVLSLGALIGWWEFDGKYPPRDADMIDTFAQHRQVFESLREKICALPDSQTIMMDPAWSRPVVSSDVRDDYYHLLRKIGAKGIQMTKEPSGNSCSVSIEYWARGWAAGGDYKKYTFNDGHLFDGETIDSLDAAPLKERQIQSFQRKLEGGWAIRYDHWP